MPDSSNFDIKLSSPVNVCSSTGNSTLTPAGDRAVDQPARVVRKTGLARLAPIVDE